MPSRYTSATPAQNAAAIVAMRERALTTGGVRRKNRAYAGRHFAKGRARRQWRVGPHERWPSIAGPGSHRCEGTEVHRRPRGGVERVADCSQKGVRVIMMEVV